MIRAIAAIAAAINLSAPSLSDDLVDVYAETLQWECLDHELDPLLVVAVVRNESHWIATAVNERTQCIGLGGICLSNYPACQDAVYYATDAECQAIKASLLDPLWNLSATAAMLESNREFCEKRIGHPVSPVDWLSSYQGFNNRAGRRGVWCNHVQGKRGKWKRVAVPKLTRQVMAFRAALERRVGRGRGAPGRTRTGVPPGSLRPALDRLSYGD